MPTLNTRNKNNLITLITQAYTVFLDFKTTQECDQETQDDEWMLGIGHVLDNDALLEEKKNTLIKTLTQNITDNPRLTREQKACILPLMTEKFHEFCYYKDWNAEFDLFSLDEKKELLHNNLNYYLDKTFSIIPDSTHTPRQFKPNNKRNSEDLSEDLPDTYNDKDLAAHKLTMH